MKSSGAKALVRSTLNAGRDDAPFGNIFTPARWARWAVREFDLAQLWLDGASLLEPTAGEGSFISALLTEALTIQPASKKLPLRRLFIVEKNPAYAAKLRADLAGEFGELGSRLDVIVDDVLFSQAIPRVDVVFGNPPWGHLNDLSPSYGTRLKGEFIRFGLVESGPGLLLGNSRADIASLFLAKLMHENLRPAGRVHFFMPRSVFFNGGAHARLTTGFVNGLPFAITSLHDFTRGAVFPEVATRYVFASLQRDRAQTYPIHLEEYDGERWSQGYLRRSSLDNSTLYAEKSDDGHAGIEKLEITKASVPRQGPNTCGANNVFIFDELLSHNAETAIFNRHGAPVELPIALMYPLLTKENFQDVKPLVRRWILLPHSTRTGKVLSAAEIEQFALAWRYLRQHQETLQNRKSKVLHPSIERGEWWAVFGVGPYSFARYKICWQAFGTSRFTPRLFECDDVFGPWQGNQAMHATMSFATLPEARCNAERLSRPNVAEVLHSTGCENTKSWAQPGRIKSLFVSVVGGPR